MFSVSDPGDGYLLADLETTGAVTIVCASYG